MATTSQLLCGIAVLLALAACDQRVPTDPLAPAGPRRALDFDTAQLSRAGYELVTIFDVPVKRDDASVPWTSTGVTLGDGELAYVIPEGSVSFTLNDVGRAICAREYQWYCGKVSGTAGPYGGVGGPSGAYDAELRLFYRVDGSGKHAQILAFASLAQGPGTIEVSRAGARDPWDYSGAQTVQIWRKRGAQPPPCTPATCEQEPSIALTCTPNPVTRGNEITCTASKEPSDAPGELKISGWSFEGKERKDGDVTSTQWQGVMVKGGVVQVRGTIGDHAVSPGKAEIRVERRQWPVMQLTDHPAVFNQLDPESMSAYPPDGKAYGRFKLLWPEFQALNIIRATSGPNTGLAVVSGPVQLRGSEVYIHPALSPTPPGLSTGSSARQLWHDWYDDQNRKGSGTCDAAGIARFRARVEVHEGVGMHANSHFFIANAALRNSKLHERFERLTTDLDDDNLRVLAVRQWESFYRNSYLPQQGQFDASDTPKVFAIGCTIDNDPRDP